MKLTRPMRQAVRLLAVQQDDFGWVREGFLYAKFHINPRTIQALIDRRVAERGMAEKFGAECVCVRLVTIARVVAEAVR